MAIDWYYLIVYSYISSVSVVWTSIHRQRLKQYVFRGILQTMGVGFAHNYIGVVLDTVFNNVSLQTLRVKLGFGKRFFSLTGYP